MNTLKKLTLVFLLVANAAYALDAEEIRRISSEPHDRKDIIEPLKIYPDAREYKITERFAADDKELQDGPEVMAKEKVVRGKYIVSESLFPGTENPLIMVVTYDSKTDNFKKWILHPNGVVSKSTGIADLEKRTIAWVSNSKPEAGDPITALAIESHADDKSTWKATVIQGEKIIYRSEGLAVKTK